MELCKRWRGLEKDLLFPSRYGGGPKTLADHGALKDKRLVRIDGLTPTMERDRANWDPLGSLFFSHYHSLSWRLSPAAELLKRLNDRLSGKDPGKPTNWRGLDK
jgi:hypothetical protein